MNYNQATQAGRLVRDPEMRYLQSGVGICQFTIANSRKYKDKSGQQKEETLFLECEAWDKLAEITTQYCRKGSVVLVAGRLKQETWDDKTSGQKRSKIKLAVESLQFGPKADDGKPATVPAAATPAPVPAPAGQPDDVPF